MDSLDVAVEHLIKLVDDGVLGDLGAFGLVETLQSLERVRNKLPVVDRAMIQYGIEQGVPGVLSERTMTRVLTTGIRLSIGEASRRVRAAEHLADRTSMTGEPLAPVRPHLAAAQRDGLVTPEQVTLIDTALRKVKHCDPAAVEAGESCWCSKPPSSATRTSTGSPPDWSRRSTPTGSCPPTKPNTACAGSSTSNTAKTAPGPETSG